MVRVFIGLLEGVLEGILEGVLEGILVGALEGILVGVLMGFLLGMADGLKLVGAIVGALIGIKSVVGDRDGNTVGDIDGNAVGSSVSVSVSHIVDEQLTAVTVAVGSLKHCDLTKAIALNIVPLQVFGIFSNGDFAELHPTSIITPQVKPVKVLPTPRNNNGLVVGELILQPRFVTRSVKDTFHWTFPSLVIGEKQA